MSFRIFLPALAAFALFLGNSHADSEIKIQGKHVTTTVWNQIDDDNGVDDNDSPRGANGTEFGNVKLGEFKTRDFRIQNTGNQTLNITSASADSSQYSFLGLNLPIAILANQDHEFQIRYTPLVHGTRTLRIVINNDEGPNNSSERRYTFRVDGTGKGPDLTIFGGNNQDDAISDGSGIPAPNDSERRHFGTVQAGDIGITTRVFTLSNDGNDGLNLSNPRFTGPEAAHFGYNGVNAGVNLGAGNARTFSILFNPPTTGTYDATFSVDTNDERNGRETYSFAVRGVAVGQPLIRVEGKSGAFASSFTRIDDGDTTPRSADGTDWGGRNIDDLVPIQDHPFRITNRGADDLTVTGITTSNEIIFQLDPATFPFTLAPDETHTFYVRFAPQNAREYDATIRIFSNSVVASVFDFAVEGRGTGALGGFGPSIRVSGLAGDPPEYVQLQDGRFETSESTGTRLPETIIGQTRTATFRIRNVGDSNLFVDASRSGSTHSEFVLIGLDSDLNIGTGTSRDIQVQFTPTALGYRSSRIDIFSDDPDIGGVFNFVVGGFATEPPVVTNGPGAYVLGGENFEQKVPPGSEQPDDENGTVIGYNGTHQSQFNLFNEGDEDLKVNGIQFDGGEGTFQINGLDSDTVVPPGAVHPFTIDYSGPNGEEIEALVIIETNVQDLEQYTFMIVSAEIEEPGPDYEPRITAIETDAFDILLTVDTPSHRTCQIFVSLDMDEWIPLFGFSQQSAGMKRIPNQISGPPTGLRRFYKVEED